MNMVLETSRARQRWFSEAKPGQEPSKPLRHPSELRNVRRNGATWLSDGLILMRLPNMGNAGRKQQRLGVVY